MDKALEKLKALKDVYQEIGTYDIGKDLKVKLKVLTSEDETGVHTHSMAFEQGIAYLYSVKRETLCRCIVGLNGTDIPLYIEEKDKEGNPEKLERHIWIREKIIEGWSQLLIDEIWLKYASLLEKFEMKITGGIVREVLDGESKDNE